MRHLLMDPAFPDIVGEWAARTAEPRRFDRANDNGDEIDGAAWDRLLDVVAAAEIAATRFW